MQKEYKSIGNFRGSDELDQIYRRINSIYGSNSKSSSLVKDKKKSFKDVPIVRIFGLRKLEPLSQYNSII